MRVSQGLYIVLITIASTFSRTCTHSFTQSWPKTVKPLDGRNQLGRRPVRHLFIHCLVIVQFLAWDDFWNNARFFYSQNVVFVCLQGDPSVWRLKFVDFVLKQDSSILQMLSPFALQGDPSGQRLMFDICRHLRCLMGHLVPGGAATCSERFCKMFSESSPGLVGFTAAAMLP